MEKIVNPRTTPLLALVLGVLFSGIVWAAYAHARPSGTKAASQSASAASAPASVASIASAPASQASRPAAKAASAPPISATSAPALNKGGQVGDKTYTVKRGDTLTRVFGRQATQVCQANFIRDCNRIEVGQKLTVPKSIAAPQTAKPKAKRVAASKPLPVKRSAPFRNDAGEILYRRVGAAPLNGCGRRDILSVAEEAWTVLGISGEDRAWLRSNIDAKSGPRLSHAPQGLVKLVPDMRLEQVTFCRHGTVVSTGPMRTAWSADEAVYGEKFVLPSGRTLVWMRNCYNWVIPKVEPVPQPLQVVQHELKLEPREEPSKEPEETPPAPTPPAKVAAAPKGMCDYVDPAGVVGQEHEPTQNGADSHSDFLTASLYCMQRLQSEDGMHGFGGKVTYSDWHGSVNNGAGHYRGWNALVGPSYKRVMDAGYDWEVSVGGGRQVETYHEAAYASRREFDLVGVTAGYNDYRRRLAGETWDVERQFFGAFTLPVGKKVGHTFLGQPIADTAELGRFNFGLQAGARWWFYEDTEKLPALPYLQGGLFVQHPTSASMSLRLGVADENRVVGIGIGLDQDLMHGGDPVAAWGWWLDLVRGIDVVVTKVRKHQVITEAAARGVTIEEKGGFVQVIRFGEPTSKP